LPFTSINYGTCTLPEGRIVIKALLEGSIKGVGKFHKTSIFPCGIFQCMKGVNREPGDPNYDMFRLALESTAKRLYPNYANVDWSGNEGYDRNDPRTYFSTMGCRTANGWDVNGFGQLKDGRGNICPVTIILPTIAMLAKESAENRFDAPVFEHQYVEEFLELLNSEDELFYKRLKKCPHYGVNDEKADSLAKDFFAKIFGSNKDKKLHFGEGFLTSSIQFTTYVYRGKGVGPTPDGRKNGEPLCDSLSPIFGNDKKAVTSMLGSVAKLDLPLALGTPVVNLRLAKKYADSMIKPMIKGYFENGGMMLQINCVSKEEMEDAMVNPDKHRDLMVRMGGYTEYFVNLSKEEQETLLTRTEHGE
jgi:hypothetical protein